LSSKRVTIKDVADKAGVSRGTVDRVLHDRGKVAEAVEARVREAAKLLDYKPNLVARSLAIQKTYVIATLLPDPTEDPFWQKPQIGINKAIDEIADFGIQVEQYHFSLFDPATFEKCAERIIDISPDAILVATEFYKAAEPFFNKTKSLGIPVVCINTEITEYTTLGYIGQDSFQSGVLAGRLFDISVPNLDGILTINIGARAVDQRHLLHKEQGLRNYFDEHNQKVQIKEIDLPLYADANKLQQSIRQALAAHSFQAIFITNSRAYHIMPILKELGCQNVCVVGFDLLEENKQFLKDGSIDFIINQDPIKQGELGIKSLFTYLMEKQPPKKLNYLPLDIVMKENCDFYH